MANKLYDGVPPNLFTSHRGVDSHYFMVEAKCWLSIIYARVILSTNDIEVALDYVLVIPTILDGLKVNIR